MMRTHLRHFGLFAAGFLSAALPHSAISAETAPTLSLEQALAQLKVPPDWIAATLITWDTAKPWQDARLEIRRLQSLQVDGVTGATVTSQAIVEGAFQALKQAGLQ